MAVFDRGQRTALVTGASSGLGRATAALQTQRFHVFGTSRRAIADYDSVEMLQMDVCDSDSGHAASSRY
jgi:NADP-dependent 3-hydroxy acid dehydrogenase YdfG